MTLRSSDLQSDSDLDSIRNYCDVSYSTHWYLFGKYKHQKEQNKSAEGRQSTDGVVAEYWVGRFRECQWWWWCWFAASWPPCSGLTRSRCPSPARRSSFESRSSGSRRWTTPWKWSPGFLWRNVGGWLLIATESLTWSEIKESTLVCIQLVNCPTRQSVVVVHWVFA